MKTTKKILIVEQDDRIKTDIVRYANSFWGIQAKEFIPPSDEEIKNKFHEYLYDSILEPMIAIRLINWFKSLLQ